MDSYLCNWNLHRAEGKALLHRKISAKRRWETKGDPQITNLTCGILQRTEHVVQNSVPTDEIEHVKNVVYKNQGLASADWNTGWWILISSVFLRTRTVTRKVF